MPTSTAHRSAGPIVGGATGRMNTIEMLPRVGTERAPSGQVPATVVTVTLEPGAIGSVGVPPQKTFEVGVLDPRGRHWTSIATARPELSDAVTLARSSGAFDRCAVPCCSRTGSVPGALTPPGSEYVDETVRLAVLGVLSAVAAAARKTGARDAAASTTRALMPRRAAATSTKFGTALATPAEPFDAGRCDSRGMDLLDRLQLEVPVVQAGLGGGIARSELAGAVSAAGALGTVATMPAPLLRRELHRAAERAPGRPVAVNLLLPYVTRGHVAAVVEVRPAVAVLFCGYDAALVAQLHEAGVRVLHQVGDADAARRAVADGADGLIVQGVEAGGHVLAVRPLAETLPAVLAVAGGRPVLAAGVIVDASSARAAMDAGAAAVVAGTRFLLTDESQAHPTYQQRVLDADATVLTRLFGIGWRDPHRVVPNAAVRRWCRPDGRERALPRALTSLTMPLARRVPIAYGPRLVRSQRVGVPAFSPSPLLRGDDERLADVTPLYAGVNGPSVEAVVSAAEAVRLLTP